MIKIFMIKTANNFSEIISDIIIGFSNQNFKQIDINNIFEKFVSEIIKPLKNTYSENISKYQNQDF